MIGSVHHREIRLALGYTPVNLFFGRPTRTLNDSVAKQHNRQLHPAIHSQFFVNKPHLVLRYLNALEAQFGGYFLVALTLADGYTQGFLFVCQQMLNAFSGFRHYFTVAEKLVGAAGGVPGTVTATVLWGDTVAAPSASFAL